MSASIATTITLQGNKEELTAMLKVLKCFATEKYEQYCKNYDCAYLDSVYVTNENLKIELKSSSEDEIEKFLGDKTKKVEVLAGGPWGDFFELSEVGLFEAMAEAAPNSCFSGSSSGFNSGGDLNLEAELKDGKLKQINSFVSDDDCYDIYRQELMDAVPYEKFCEIFKLKPEGTGDEDDCFDEDSFWDINNEHYLEYSYKDFVSMTGSEITEKEFTDAIKNIRKSGILDFDAFCEEMEEDSKAISIYNPITRKYE